MSTIILQHNQQAFSLVQKIQAVMGILNRWMERHHQRKQLAQLELNQLKDIGLDLAMVQAEINKPFWK